MYRLANRSLKIYSADEYQMDKELMAKYGLFRVVNLLGHRRKCLVNCCGSPGNPLVLIFFSSFFNAVSPLTTLEVILASSERLRELHTPDPFTELSPHLSL